MTTDATLNESPQDDAPEMVLTAEQSWERFQADVQRRLGISGEEFVRRLDAGEYGDPDHDGTIMWFAFWYEGLRGAGFSR